MIFRLFRARVRPGQEETYRHFLERTTVPFLRKQAGCLEVRVGHHYTPDGESEYMVLSVWDSMDHLRVATGARWDQPVIDPEEAPLLSASDIDHFDEV